MLSLTRTFRSSKVPSTTADFWFLKIVTTAMGESTSDFLVHHFSPVLAVLAGAVVFTFALYAQLRAPRYLVVTYWSAVVMVSVFGTMCADAVHVGLGVPYVISAICFALALAGIFVTWRHFESTLSIHSITTTRRELFYWSTVTATFALGTATGDMTAYTLNFGFFSSALWFSVLLTMPALYFALTRKNAIASFWCAYVLTRPVGASFADWCGVSTLRGGLDWGPGNVAMALTLLIVINVVLLAWRTSSQMRTSVVRL
ncbi:MAG: hypothetical protein HIU84_10595 [Acidobacteria bacterium]|nr:hypothetical protein [Acidobacteriota bacterium]